MSEHPSRLDGLSRRDLLSPACTLPLRRSFGRQQPARPGLKNLRASRAHAVTDGSDTAITLSARLTRASAVTDFWSGAAMSSSRVITIADMPAHSARLLECRDV